MIFLWISFIFLQLNNEFSSLVWSTDKITAKSLLDLPPDVFTDRINQALVSINLEQFSHFQ